MQANRLKISHFNWWYAPAIYFIANFCLVALSFLNISGEWLAPLQFIAYALVSFGFIALCQSRLSATDFPFALTHWQRGITYLIAALIAFELVVYWFEHANTAAKESSQAVLQSMNFGDSAQRDFLLLMSICCLAPIGEELLFRGVIFRSLRDGLLRFMPFKLSLPIAVLVSASAFAISHGTPEQAVQLGILFLMGVVAALLYEYTGSLSAPILFHCLNNIFAIYADSDVILALGLTKAFIYTLLIVSLLLCLFILVLFSAYLKSRPNHAEA